MNNERITYLLQKAQNRSATIAEYDELLQYIQADASGNILAQLDSFHADYIDKQAYRHENTDWNGVLQQILQIHQQVRSAPVQPFYRRRTPWLAAASVILILTGACFLYISKNILKKDAPVAATTLPDIPPGGNKAVLTLGNGKTVVLDSAANGLLLQEGGSHISKVTNGQIAYEPIGKSQPAAPPQNNTLTTPCGGQYQLQLPDGSKVWLNASSSITYPTAFTGKERLVSISGEVYIEVAANKNSPFHVVVNNIQIEVLGTSFNIKAYADEQAITTTLLTGAVRVVKDNSSMLMQPGDQATIIAGSHAAPQLQHQVAIDEVIAWKNGLFNFKDADITEIMKQLSRWYNIDVIFERAPSREKYKGMVPMNTTLQEMIQVLSINGMDYTITGRQLIIH